MSLSLRKTHTIIVGTIIIKDDKILLIQEAKTECFGKYYLPAGRLEPGENLIEGAKREILEESGIIAEIICLISVEMITREWCRVSFLGKEIGGTLKKEADKESLGAKWIPIASVEKLELRSKDFLKILDKSRLIDTTNFFKILPLVNPAKNFEIEIHCIISSRSILLVNQNNKPPRILLKTHDPVVSNFKLFYEECFGVHIHKMLTSLPLFGLEYSGTSNSVSNILEKTDGILFQVVFEVEENLEKQIKSNYLWKTYDKTYPEDLRLLPILHIH